MKQKINGILLLICLVLTCAFFDACKKKGNTPNPASFAIAEENLSIDTTFVTIEGKYTFDVEIDTLTVQLRPNATNDAPQSFATQLDGKHFSVTLTNLAPNTTYNYWYVAEYADDQTITTEAKQFTTLNQINNGDGDEEAELPTVNTLEMTYVGSDMAIGGGEVTHDGNAEVTARGLCWGLQPEPTIEDPHTLDSCGIGQFVSEIYDLTAATVYYVRAYATNEVGTAYGETKSFTTLSMIPVVHTLEIVEVSETSAIVSGEVTDEAGNAVTERGICWSLHEEPSIDDEHIACGSGLDEFVGELTGLLPETTYYARAYARNANGTGYGKVMPFTTLAPPVQPLKVVTVEVNSISLSHAVAVGEVVSDGGFAVTERGICWGTESHPTIDDNHLANGSGLGVFEVDLSCLRGKTMYFVRAYAINAEGIAYGNQKLLNTTTNSPTGAAKGLFSIDECRQVWFSKGNLQYIGSAATPYWKFAEQQWEILASFTGQNSDSPDVE